MATIETISISVDTSEATAVIQELIALIDVAQIKADTLKVSLSSLATAHPIPAAVTLKFNGNQLEGALNLCADRNGRVLPNPALQVTPAPTSGGTTC